MALYDDSLAAFRSGDNERARTLAEQALTEAQVADNIAGQVDALCMLARVALRAGSFDRVDAIADEAREVAAGAGQVRLERMPLHMQAVAARMNRDYVSARRLYEESIELNSSLGDNRMVAAEFHNLAYVELHDGRPGRARELFAAARKRVEESNYESLRPYIVGDAAVLAAEDGDYRRAARLAGSAHSALTAAGQVADPDDATEQNLLCARLAESLGQEVFEAAYNAGASLSVTDALQEVY